MVHMRSLDEVAIPDDAPIDGDWVTFVYYHQFMQYERRMLSGVLGHVESENPDGSRVPVFAYVFYIIDGQVVFPHDGVPEFIEDQFDNLMDDQGRLLV